MCTDERGMSRPTPVVFCGPAKRDPCEERWKMTITVLTRDDRKALMDALESPSPGVRQARVAQALLLMADGVPAPTVARYLFLPESVILQYWQAFTSARTADRETALLPAGAGTHGEDSPLATRFDVPLRRSLPRCRKWVSGARDSGTG